MRSSAWAMAALVAFVPAIPLARRSSRSKHAAPHVVTAAPNVSLHAAATPPAPATEAVPPPSFHRTTQGLCTYESRPDAQWHFVARADLGVNVLDPNAALAPVSRSAASALAPDFAPDDLVDLATMAPARPEACDPPGGECLRHDAAAALRDLFAAMRAAGHEPFVHSAFRAYASQCGVFRKWVSENRGGVCAAAEQSARSGHSQHQLGTALDLFTAAWAARGPVFRAGFACSPGGRWLADHSWEHGFVLSYPLPPAYRSHIEPCWERSDIELTVDPRSGYRYEPWHFRYVGVDAARAFHAAWLASGPGTGGEITLDQWLRARAGLAGDADLPVCDGCACGACSTTADHAGSDTPCGDDALRLGPDGRPVMASEPPHIDEVRVHRRADAPTLVVVEVRLRVPPHTVTQTPALGLDTQPFDSNTTFGHAGFVPGGPARAYPDLPGAIRLGIAPDDDGAWPWRAALADPEVVGPWNGADLYLPTPSGSRWFRVLVRLPIERHALRLALLRDGNALGAPVAVDVP